MKLDQEKELSAPEFFLLFDASVHEQMLISVEKFQASHLVCYEVCDLSSSSLGDRSVLPIGGSASTADLTEASVLRMGNLPSNFQYAVSYMTVTPDIREQVMKAKNWGKPFVPEPKVRRDIGRRTDPDLMPSEEDLKSQMILVRFYQDHPVKAIPCILRFDRKAYAAVKISNGEKDQSFRIIGDVPQHTRKNVVYCLDGQEGEWFLAWHYSGVKVNPFNPSGNTFTITKWVYDDEPLDGFDTPRPKISIFVYYN